MREEEVTGAFADVAEFTVLGLPGAKVFYLAPLCDGKKLDSFVLSPLLSPSGGPLRGAVREHRGAETAVGAILGGEAAVLYGDGKLVTVGVQNELSRGIGEPETETVLRGSREGFTERAESNIALLRRRLRTEKLKSEGFTVGRVSHTRMTLLWIEGLAPPSLIEETRRRLSAIDTDALFDSGKVEIAIEDGRVPLFPTVGNSERPDKVAGKLLEGRCAIVTDGTPVVLTVPYLFAEALQSTEDYSKSPYYATLVRLLRFVSLLLALYLPALFIALYCFHPTAIPSTLLDKIGQTREGIPFSPFVEVLLTLFTFEMIREVGIRMPKSVGSAVSLAAALVLGDSAIEAGVSSAPGIIVVAVAAIGSFLVPPYMNVTILLRILFLFAARIAGIFGIGTVTVALLLHLCAKTSFGTPYFSPFAPVSGTGMLDFLTMAPFFAMKKVPAPITGRDKTRNGGKRI